MDYFEQDGINEELVEHAIRESIQDAYKLPCTTQINRKESNSEEFMNIMAAIENGHFCVLHILSGCPSAFRESDSRGWQALHAASAQPQVEILHLVLDVLRSTDVTLEETTEDGDTPLTLAAEAGAVENVKLLLERGASPYNTNGRNETPLVIAVRQKLYDMVLSLILGGAFVEQVCLTKWTATHEAAKVGCPAILKLLLRHGAKINTRDGQGTTPLGIAAKYGNAEALELFIMQGGDVNAQASNGGTALCDAAGSGNMDCIKLLLQHRANPNVASYSCHLPIHRAAYEGHTLALSTLIPLTTKKAIRLTGQNPVHSAADGGQVECLKLLLKRGYEVNALLDAHISENYGDLRKSALYFAVSNGDIACAEILLAYRARTDLDPLRCILVAVRAERHDLVRLLLSYGAEVNCYFSVVSNTQFPTALQYCLGDHVMLRLLLNNGYHAYKCFLCGHDNCEELDSSWTELINQFQQIYSQPSAISFCEYVSVAWLTHLVGGVVRMLLDYVSHVNICDNLKRILERSLEWEEISDILSNPRSLQHLCRLRIRGFISLRMLNSPKAMAKAPYPPGLKNYLTYRDYDLYGDLASM
uniref:ankyrin repeat and SOCS box protein 15b n=1 Tax=Semicossyphus pulcher TaxID=241346 RepID=UPI0037E70AB0